jgi:pentatricopeptide repeat protein
MWRVARALNAARPAAFVACAESLNRAGVHDAAGRVRHKEFLSACAAQRAVSEAFQFVRLISPPDVRAFNLLLSLCAAVGDADAAFRAFRELSATGLRPDCLAFTTLIAACSKAGEVERAFEVYGDMRRAHVSPSTVTFGALLDALSRDIGRAAVAGDKARVRERLAQCNALQAEHRAAGVPADAVMYNSFVSACGRAAAVDRHALGAAFAARREMQEQGLALCAYTYSALIDGCTRSGDPARSLQVWDEFAATSLERTPEVVGAAAHACAALGDLDRAMSIYYDALASGLRPDGVLFAILMVRARVRARACARAEGGWDDRPCMDMHCHYVRDHAFLTHAPQPTSPQDVAAKAGDAEFAFALQEEMTRVGVPADAAVFATLIGICAREAAAPRAKSVFQAMRTAGVRPTASAVNALVAAHARAGDLEGAFGALSELPAAGLVPDATTYATLIGACARARDLERAWKVLRRCKEAQIEPPAEAYHAIIAGHAAAGQLAQAAQAEEELRSAGHALDAPTARTLLTAYARAGDAAAVWRTWRAAVEAELVLSEALLNTVLGACLQRIRQLEEDAMFVQGMDAGVAAQSELDRTKWERRAISAYTDATASGVVPRIETLSTLLACLRQSQPRVSRRTAAATAAALSPAVNAVIAAAREPPNAGGATAGLYPERALVLYEEAQAAGVVPRFNLSAPGEVDLRPLPPAAAEVCVLTLLRVMRRRRTASGDSLKMHPVVLRVHDVAELMALTAGASRGVALRRARTGIRAAELLRRLGLPFAGDVSHGACALHLRSRVRFVTALTRALRGTGSLELSEGALLRWLRPEAPGRLSTPFSAKARGLPGTEARLPNDLREQQKRFRAGDAPPFLSGPQQQQQPRAPP